MANEKRMTLSEVEDRLAALSEEKEAIRNEMRALVRARDEALAVESAKAKVAAMSPSERKVLGLPEPEVEEPKEEKPPAQVVHGVGGIESRETFTK